MKVRYTRRAFLDRETIFDYLRERSPNAAINVQHAVLRAISALETYPALGRSTDFAGVRELIVPRHPYKIYYRVDGEEIWILHVRDARRKPWSPD